MSRNRVGLSLHIINTFSRGATMRDPFEKSPVLQLRPQALHKPMGREWHLLAAAVLTWGAIAGVVSFALARLLGWF
jgi:hypothetical protein